jgi:lipopolysaccharide/colanic/teichoic acid biosynthesis glycosyltransferase
MSPVGPRPLTDVDVQRLGWTRSEFDFRWSQRQGLTGLAQITGALSGEESLQFDRAYIARWRPLLDCQLIALSFAVNAFGKARVQRWIRSSRLASAPRRVNGARA